MATLWAPILNSSANIEYLARAVQYQSGKMSWMQGNQNMESLKKMHQQILHNVEMVQDRSSKILQEQEKDLLRAFRARLFDVQVGIVDILKTSPGGLYAYNSHAPGHIRLHYFA